MSGAVPQASPRLTCGDRWGTVRARWGVGRMEYRVPPGLYRVGNPGPGSPVLVTANYKMSFDRLRETLPGRDAWMLVLDTAGINVWCAAGKGTFGTGELVRRVEEARLAEVVSHRRLILPQLGAPGVAAHLVRERTGFSVLYGPVEARDLPAFLDAGLSCPPGHRRKRFPLRDRAALIPVELVGAVRLAVPAVLALAVLGGLAGLLPGGGGFLPAALARLTTALLALALVLGAGVALFPLLLPVLPGRAFSLKGVWLALAAGAGFLALRSSPWEGLPRSLETAAFLLAIPALVSFLSLNFTGSSTYTSLSGVRREMRLALPLQAGAAALGLLLWLGSLVAERLG